MSVRRSLGLAAVLSCLWVPGLASSQELSRTNLEPFIPPACTPGQEMFSDVPASSPFCPWIEQLARDHVTGGCGPQLFCPTAPLTRQQMAAFLELAMRGTDTWIVNADLLDGMDSGDFVSAVSAGTGLTGGGSGGSLTIGLAPSYQLPQTCTNGQRPAWNGAGWACGNPGTGTVTSVGTGAGLTGGPITTSGTIAVAAGGITSAMIADGTVAGADIADGTVGSADVNSAQVQRRVGGTCAAGTGMRTVNADGTVTCEAFAGPVHSHFGASWSGSATEGLTVVNSDSNGIGLWAQGTAPTGITNSVLAENWSTNGTALFGVQHATSGQAHGVVGETYSANGAGVLAVAFGTGNHYGVFSSSSSGYAGYFSGAAHVNGTFTATVKNFKIDHPLDPANKYLSHASIESSEMLNLYSGTVVLDGSGSATVSLPGWFEALNRDFRYQLTCIGGYAPVYVASEIEDGRFTIAGGRAGLKVSWQVVGARKDAYAVIHPLVVEEDKPADERGTYMHPAEHGQPAERGRDYTITTALRRAAAK